MQDFEGDAVPFPALPGGAAPRRAHGLQLVAFLDRAQERGPRLHRQHRRRAARVVGVAVAQHQRVHLLVERPQQRHQHAVAGVALGAVARPRVVHQGVAGRAHDHRVALADVGRQQFEFARRRPRHLPEHDGQQQRHPEQANVPRQPQRQQDAAQHAGRPGPLRGRRRGDRRERQRREPAQVDAERLQGPGRHVPEGRHEHAGQRERRHHERDPRNGERVGQQAHHRHLAEEQQRQRRQRQRDHPLLAEHGPDACPQAACAAPRGGPRALGRPGGAQLARSVRPGTGSEQHADRHETQPEPGLQQRPGIESDDHRAGQQPHLRPGPAPPRQAQQAHGGEHPHGPLRRHAPAAEQRVRRGQHDAARERRVLRRPRQAKAGAAPPQRPHEQGSGPGEHGDVQARDAHQVGHAGGAEDIPVRAVDRVLVAHDQCGQQARRLAVRNALHHRITHVLARALDGVQPRRADAPRRRVARPGAHIAGGLQALLPEPQLVVEAVRVAVAVRRLQAHRHLPALAGVEFRGLPLQFEDTVGARHRAAVPAQVQPRRHLDGFIGERRRIHVQPKPDAGLVALGHGGDHAGHGDVAAFESRVKRAGCEMDGAQAAQRECNGGNGKKHPDRPHASPRPAGERAENHHPQSDHGTVSRPPPQLRLLHLQGRAQHGAQQRRRHPPWVVVAHVAMHNGARGPAADTPPRAEITSIRAPDLLVSTACPSTPH